MQKSKLETQPRRRYIIILISFLLLVSSYYFLWSQLVMSFVAALVGLAFIRQLYPDFGTGFADERVRGLMRDVVISYVTLAIIFAVLAKLSTGIDLSTAHVTWCEDLADPSTCGSGTLQGYYSAMND